MRKFLVVPAIIFGLLTGCAVGADPSIAAISDKMRTLAGPDALECGAVKPGGPLDQAWECATSADRSKRSFWLAVEGHRTDSAVWHVVARTASGERYIVFYTSNEAGQPSFEPSFTVTPCNEPFQLFRDELFRLRCGPDVP